MAQTITISNITKVSDSTYSVEFSANFILLSELFYQISLDGNTWSNDVEITNTSSPVIITVQNHINFMLRLHSEYIQPRIHSQAYSGVHN